MKLKARLVYLRHCLINFWKEKLRRRNNKKEWLEHYRKQGIVPRKKGIRKWK